MRYWRALTKHSKLLGGAKAIRLSQENRVKESQISNFEILWFRLRCSLTYLNVN